MVFAIETKSKAPSSQITSNSTKNEVSSSSSFFHLEQARNSVEIEKYIDHKFNDIKLKSVQKKLERTQSNNEKSLLFSAIEDKDKEKVLILLQNGEDIQVTNTEGHTPLYYSIVIAKDLEIVKILLDYNADLFLKNSELQNTHLTYLGIILSAKSYYFPKFNLQNFKSDVEKNRISKSDIIDMIKIYIEKNNLESTTPDIKNQNKTKQKFNENLFNKTLDSSLGIFAIGGSISLALAYFIEAALGLWFTLVPLVLLITNWASYFALKQK